MDAGRFPFAALALAALVALSSCARSQKPVEAAPSVPDTAQTEMSAEAELRPPEPELNEARFYDALSFSRHDRQSEAWELSSLKAIVAPHYTPMLHMLSSALKSAAESETPVDTVLIIGPDHTGKGGGISLSGRGWRTPEGDLPGDGELFSALMQNRTIGASENDELLQSDHAAAVLVPYVAKYLPDTRVVTALIGKYTAHSRLIALAEAIFGAQQDKNVLLICSVDFSHYLPREQAERRDRETICAINTSDIAGILNMNSENTDSPECLGVFIELAALWDVFPELCAHETDLYNDAGEWLAGSYMAWALCK